MLAQAMIGGHPRRHTALPPLGLLVAALTALGPLRRTVAQSVLNDYSSAFAAYHWADPLVEWPEKKLVERIPALSGLEPAADQSRLPAVLARVGTDVQAFRGNFVNTTSTETVEESRTKLDGSWEKRGNRQEFRYLMLAPSNRNSNFKEYRTDLAGHEEAPRNPKPGFVKTSGFASIPLLLDPEHQPAYDFKYLGSQSIDGRKAEVIAFAGHPAPEAVSGQYVLFGKPIPLIVQGVAWIDDSSFEVLRMHTDLLAPLTFAGLTRLTTDAAYHEVSFRKGSIVCWLPRVVDVTADFYGRSYHNRHSYSDYELFSVDSGEKVATPNLPPPPPGHN